MKKEIDACLSFLPIAISTITAPQEVWNQGTQIGFIKAFKKSTGGVRGCLVFVMTETLKVKTYFLKDLKALDKAGKGLSMQIFNQKKMVLISVDARQAEPSGLSRTRHHRESVVNVLPFFEKSNFGVHRRFVPEICRKSP